MMSRLEEIAEIASGVTFRSGIHESPDGNVRVILMDDLGEDGLVNLNGATRVRHDNVRPDQYMRGGDIIFRSRGRVHTAALLGEDAEDAEDVVVAAPLFRVRPDKGKVDPEYLLWWINQPASQAYFDSHSRGTTVKMIGKQTLEYLEVRLPSLEKQKEIAKYFNLSMKEQEILEEIKSERMSYIHGSLMRMALEA